MTTATRFPTRAQLYPDVSNIAWSCSLLSGERDARECLVIDEKKAKDHQNDPGAACQGVNSPHVHARESGSMTALVSKSSKNNCTLSWLGTFESALARAPTDLLAGHLLKIPHWQPWQRALQWQEPRVSGQAQETL